MGSVLNGNLTVQVLKLDLTVPLRKGSETTSGTAKLTSTVRVRRQSTKAARSMLEGRGESPEGKVGCTGAEADFKSPFECNIPESVTRTVSTPDNQQPKRITLDLSSRSGSNKSISHEEAARLRNLLQVGPNPQCAIFHALNSCVAIAMHREAPHASSTERGLHSPISCAMNAHLTLRHPNFTCTIHVARDFHVHWHAWRQDLYDRHPASVQVLEGSQRRS